MENTQNVQNHSSQVQTSESELRNSQSKLISSRNIVIHTFIKYHWLFLIGSLGVFIGSAAISLYSLTHVDLIASEQADRTKVEVTQAITVPPQKSSSVPLWMIAAIALSCASGCLLLCRWVNRPVKVKKYRKQEIRADKPIKKSREPILQAHSSVKNDRRKVVPPSQTRLPQSGTYRRNRTKPTPTQLPTRTKTKIPAQIPTQMPTQIPIKRVATPRISTIPPQGKSFLLKSQDFKSQQFKSQDFESKDFKSQDFKSQDFKSQESLLDMMDLRKQNYLSNILQKK